MARTAGRDQLAPMERLIRILICLADEGRAGVPIGRLLRMADLTEDTDATRAQLRRDLLILRQGGWDIRNVATEGADARYVLTSHDNRLAVLLTPGETAALQLALTDAALDHNAPPPHLEVLQHAIAVRSLVTFQFEGRQHSVHPDALYSTSLGWVLSGRDTETLASREFVTAWMGEPTIRAPHTALPAVPAAEREHPMRWRLDEPTTVRIAVLHDYEHNLRVLMPDAEIIEVTERETTFEVIVTNRATFLTRLYALGLHARVVAPAALVDQIVANLRAVAAGGDDDADLR